jgi:hypothetical protein
VAREEEEEEMRRTKRRTWAMQESWRNSGVG